MRTIKPQSIKKNTDAQSFPGSYKKMTEKINTSFSASTYRPSSQLIHPSVGLHPRGKQLARRSNVNLLGPLPWITAGNVRNRRFWTLTFSSSKLISTSSKCWLKKTKKTKVAICLIRCKMFIFAVTNERSFFIFFTKLISTHTVKYLCQCHWGYRYRTSLLQKLLLLYTRATSFATFGSLGKPYLRFHLDSETVMPCYPRLYHILSGK